MPALSSASWHVCGLAILALRSGRTMARSGLRMTPTFPSSSRRFRQPIRALRRRCP